MTHKHSYTVRQSDHHQVWLNIDAGELAGTGKLGIALLTQAEVELEQCAVIIDFTLPEALAANLEWAVTHNTPIVIGTTGLNTVS